MYLGIYRPVKNQFKFIFQERLRSLHRLIYDIDGERGRNEQCIESILRAEKAAESPPANEDSSSSSQQVLMKSYLWIDKKIIFILLECFLIINVLCDGLECCFGHENI